MEQLFQGDGSDTSTRYGAPKPLPNLTMKRLCVYRACTPDELPLRPLWCGTDPKAGDVAAWDAAEATPMGQWIVGVADGEEAFRMRGQLTNTLSNSKPDG